jgi:enamine deaminase RidA (YjgF/YER057c/UK114 family)
MRKNIFLRHEREFIALSSEGRLGRTVGEETQELFQRVEKELRESSLSLENTVRIRIWGKDREARNLATSERSKIFTDRTKASSSSYVCPEHFDSSARVALDLIALRPANSSPKRKTVEFDPPRNYLRFLIYDSYLFLSGLTSAGSTLDNQLAQILAEIEVSLTDGGSSWEKVNGASFYLHRSQKVELLKGLMEKKKGVGIPQMEFCFVDGFASEGRLLEVEITANINK